MDSYPSRVQKHLTVLGFDFGTKRIGAAVGQSLTGTAQTLPIIPARDGIPDWDMLRALVTRWQPDVFVVGLPYNMDDSESDLLLRARKFGKRLEGQLHKPCFGIDERLTSFVARGEILRGNRDDAVDSIAARLIVESWLAGLPAVSPATPS
ncbi:MAG: Holliday junction resolvase RuvX [Gammaproteobacteria bacterium]|nr:Holliday junction resolvase RuvX [Gammaproteobacteria bacterium]MBJ56336.1 Holliday junction resolvase RuvX [Gammaproteobacteria bacterium]HBN15762.1 Holliday junction resolvase RuvX [Pseudohongiella sp.]|tara:strand:- start:1178 stop:1630 length:453 start_codon:yes stop_codon:yes gene_type:complete